jgi:Family of unknown function (DUF5689)
MKKVFQSALCLFFAINVFSISSCVDDDFDSPPATGTDPELTANKSIAQIKALFVSGQVLTIDSDYIFEAVVVADDKDGNFYKSIVLQDSTGGINIQIDQSNYYSYYKVGRKVFVKCKGLVIGDYNDLIQLGGYIDNSAATPQVGRIPQSLIPQHLIGGVWDQSYDTLSVSNFNLLSNTADQNKLVRLDNVHFETPCQTWADMVGQTSGNRNLLDAGGNVIVVRTSNFTTFGAQLVPGGTGTVIGVFQIFGSTRQLVLRNLNDVLMAPPSCAVWGPTNKLRDLRTMFSQGVTTVPAGSVVKGIVISDYINANLNNRNMVIQDSTGGMLIRFTGAHTFALGDEVEVNVGNQVFTSFHGLLEVDAVSNALATKTGTGTVTPRLATVADIAANGEAWESTLVRIDAATLSGSGSTYTGTLNLIDATGTVALFTSGGATFAGTAYPTSTVQVTAIVSEYDVRQLNIRNTSDVQP